MQGTACLHADKPMEEEMKKTLVHPNKKKTEGVVYFGVVDSPLGNLYVALEGQDVVALSFTSASEDEFRRELASLTPKTIVRSDAAIRPIARELREYFRGIRKKFTFHPRTAGFTNFQKKVLRAAASIPYGQTRTYRWLAECAGSPRAGRAAGQVMARNPVPIIIPCHRVIGSSGDLCGFAGGFKALNLKRKLLATENAVF
jgi:methylated-DNA-[protein]-cysteine S-methyltransferase